MIENDSVLKNVCHTLRDILHWNKKQKIRSLLPNVFMPIDNELFLPVTSRDVSPVQCLSLPPSPVRRF